MFTGSGSEEIAVKAMQSGLDDYVLKGARHAARLPLALRAAIERRWLRRTVVASDERYQALFQRVPFGLFRGTAEGQLVEVNPALAGLLGLDGSPAAAGRFWRDFWTDRGACERWTADIDGSTVAVRAETTIRRVDGERRTVALEARAVTDELGRRWHEGSVVEIAAADGDAMPDASRPDPATLIPAALRPQYEDGGARYAASGHPSITDSSIDVAGRAGGREMTLELALVPTDVTDPPIYVAFVRDIRESTPEPQ